MTAQLEVGDIVSCTVESISGAIVFVKIDGNREGTIITSEIAPGRIRNLREYVVPKKKIICKVLRVSGEKIDLSLRRVTQKEKKEILEQAKQEKSYKAIFKTILGKEETPKIIEKIEKEEKFYEFVEEIKENPKELEKLVGKENTEKILEILKSQKQKTITLKKELLITTSAPNGLELIKNILGEIKNAEIKYISAGKYSIQTEDENIKSADNKLKTIIEDLEKKTKKQNMEFSVKGQKA
ncbi:hypothetical protein J4481_02435 [Candidatus Pacearchaeota archaeon]|nr:hypothetical protein [Candidatus Pacearchaeota archaeon]